MLGGQSENPSSLLDSTRHPDPLTGHLNMNINNNNNNNNSHIIPIIRPPTLKRGRDVTPLSERVELERVLGLTVTSSAAVAVDPSSATVAYPAGCVVILYNTKTNRQSHIISPSKKTITSLAFSWDGRYLATGECGHQPQLRIWDVQEKSQVAEFPGHKYGINCVAFSPNLKYVVSVGSQHDSVVNVWDWKSDTKVASNKVSSKVKCVSFAASGNYFVTVGNRHVKFWYLEHAKIASNMAEPMPLMGRSAILGDRRDNNFCDADCGKGSLHENSYAITKSGLLCVFNSRRLLDKWVELKTSVANSISVGEDRIFVGCSDGIVRCFDPHTLQFICTLPRPHHLGVDVAKGVNPNNAMHHPENSRYPDVVALAYDEIHKRVSCVYNDHSLYVWSVTETKRVGKCFSYLFHSACIWGIETYPGALTGLPKGTFLTCSSDDTIRAWNINDPTIKRNLFCSELLKVVYMDAKLTYICDIDLQNTNNSNEKVDTNYDGKNGVRCMKISHDGSHLACGDRSGNITIFGVPEMEQLGKIEAHDSEVLCLEYTSPQTCGFRYLLASGSRDRFIHLFDVSRSYQFIKTLADHSSSITALKFVRSPLKGSLSSSGQNNVQMISCGADKQIIFRRAQFSGSETSSDISFNREHLVSGKCTLFDMELDQQEKHILTACQDRHVRVYSVTSSKNTRTFRGAQGEDGTLIKVVLDPTGTFVATSCTDKSLYIYDYQSAECLAQMFGHSELVTGLKFSEDGKNLISVSGDGCIFVWKLPVDISSVIQTKMGISENDNTIIWGQNVPNKHPEDLPLPTSPIVTDSNGNQTHSAPVTPTEDGKLPNWAKKRVGGDVGDTNGGSPSPIARGKWAESMQQDGNPLVIKSVLASDPVVPLPRVKKSKSESAVNVVVNSAEIVTIAENPAEFQASPENLSEILSTTTKPPPTNNTINSNNIEGRPQAAMRTHSPPSTLLARMRLGHNTDSSGASSMKTTGDDDADCERSDTDNSDKQMFFANQEASGSSFNVKLGQGQTSLSQPSSGSSSGFIDLVEARRRLKSRELAANSDLNSDSDRDSATPSKIGDRNSLFMSTENLEKLGKREKFMKSNYESLGKSIEEEATTPISRKSITAKFKSTPEEEKEQKEKELQLSKSSTNLFERSTSSLSSTPVKPIAKKPMMSPWASGNHREELSKALQEAKQRLQGVGKGHKLSTSKSIGDLLSLKDRKDFNSDNDKLNSDRENSKREDLIRRSTSMSDISGGASRLFTSRRKSTQDTEDTADGSLSATGGIWAQQQKTQFPSYATTPRKYGTSAMSRSASMGSLNNPSLYQGNHDAQMMAQQQQNINSIHRAPSAHSLRRGNTNLTKVRSSSALNRNSLVNKHLLSPDSDSDSDSESTTLSDAVTHRHSLSRSFSRQSQVGMVQPHPGVSSNGNRHNTFTLPRRYSSTSNHGEGPRALVEPMPQTNVINQPLSQDLCDRVAEELKRVSRQAIQLFQRVTLNMDLPPSVKSTMTQTLASSVLQAQQHLSLAAPPPSMNPMAAAMINHQPLQSQQSLQHQHQHQQQQHQPNVTLDASALSMLLGQAQAPQDQTSNNSINNVLQQYTQHILKMVEEKISQAKPDSGSK